MLVWPNDLIMVEKVIGREDRGEMGMMLMIMTVKYIKKRLVSIYL